MSLTSQQTGLRGEQIARSFIQQKGFRVETSNWRSGKLGEIDLIVFHPVQQILAFIEVKTRKTPFLESPLEAIDARKVSQLLNLANAYLAAHPVHESVSVRFDVIGISFAGKNKPAAIVHLENAFGADG